MGDRFYNDVELPELPPDSPATPAPGFVALYGRAGRAYSKDSAGNEVLLGGGNMAPASTAFVDGGSFTTNITPAPRFQVDFGSFYAEGVVTPPALNDPNFANVSALLHMDGANGATTFPDSSPRPKTFAALGAAQVSTAQSRFGGASLLLDGLSAYLEAPSSVDFDFGTGDFTVEAWMYTATVAVGQGVIIGRQEPGANAGFQFRRNNSTLQLEMRATGNGPLFSISTPANSLVVNAWHHVAATRSGTTISLFVDGALLASGASATNANCVRPLTIGVLNDTGPLAGFFQGHIDEVRITKGTARYTANFTPPTTAFPNA